jgi:hypothetical protein
MYNSSKGLCGIATALHVVENADEWQQPIKLIHHLSGKNLFLKGSDRAILTNPLTDSAVILIPKPDFPFPDNTLPLLPVSNKLEIGNEVGWLGFPGIDSKVLCFFSGNISAKKDKNYLIDGVAIHGVSGGPVLYVTQTEGVQIVGIVSFYRANRLTGETLPGLLYAQDVSHFHDVINSIKSIEDAKQKQQEELEQKKKTEEAPQLVVNTENQKTTSSNKQKITKTRKPSKYKKT